MHFPTHPTWALMTALILPIFPLHYSTLYDAIHSVMVIGRGALMAKSDVKSAFRNALAGPVLFRQGTSLWSEVCPLYIQLSCGSYSVDSQTRGHGSQPFLKCNWHIHIKPHTTSIHTYANLQCLCYGNMHIYLLCMYVIQVYVHIAITCMPCMSARGQSLKDLCG